MKVVFASLVLLFSGIFIHPQGSGSHIEIVTVYSQNERFYLKSIPFDNEFPTLRGRTFIYEAGNPTPLYVFERGFDSIRKDRNNLIVSNNGEVIFFVLPWFAKDDKEGLKSITIYKNGKIIKSFTEAEITGCDYNKERCDLLYFNNDKVIDNVKSNSGTRNYKRVFKEGVSETEKFLNDFPLFSIDDTVYLIDSKKKVHIFDLKTAGYGKSDSFENIFEQVKGDARFNKIELESLKAPVFLNFPNLKDKRDTFESLTKFIGMKSVYPGDEKNEKFKWYRLKLNANLFQDGSVEIEDIELDAELPKEKIIEFFKVNKFDGSSVPKVSEKWNIGNEYFIFRKSDDKLARKEKQEEIIRQREASKKRLVAERINDTYIPKDLGECFIELNKLLSEINKKEIQTLTKREDTVKYHMDLGLWIRNNWGLWSSSRLQKYFTDKGITHPDDMSGIILIHYYDWLNGKTETWKNWEKNPKQ